MPKLPRWRSLALMLLVGRSAPPARLNAQTPSPRGHHTLFYDGKRERVMLAGGTAARNRQYELLNDLWSFDGARWMRVGAGGDRMSGARVAVDAQHRVFSFGGWREKSLGDLRLLENDVWRRVGLHPSVVAAEGGFVFDASRNRFVAFGGVASQPLAEVWEYDSARWTKHPAAPPPPRFMHAMVYDTRRKRTVVFGGQGARANGGNAPMLGDTWEFDGNTWTRRDVSGPSGRLGVGAAYDAKRSLVMVFGGANETGVLNDLWAWDGAVWKKLAEGGPEPRVYGYVAYDQKRDRLVLFGGRRGAPDDTDLGDTWEWDGSAWRQITP